MKLEAGYVGDGQYIDWNEKLRKATDDLARKYSIKSEELTEFQIAEALRQALACGDFQKNITPSGASSVDYIPYRQYQAALSKIEALEAAMTAIKHAIMLVEQ